MQYISRMQSVTAIIPVRSGSTRCPQKNSRPFANVDTNLLKLKISVLKRVKNISDVIVSSSDQELLEMACSMGAKIHERNPIYSSNETTGSELFKCLAEAVEDEHMMYVTCVSPFVQATTYERAIGLYFDNIRGNKYDSVVACRSVTEFLWLDNQPLNYEQSLAPPSQNLPDINALTFGFNILRTDYVREHCSIVGKAPLMYGVTELEAIDIDTQFDFAVAELLYSNAFFELQDVTVHNELTREAKFELLDCTIRDGGYLNNWNFSLEEVLDMYRATSCAGIEYFEIGFTCTHFDPRCGRWWNITAADVIEIKEKYPSGCKLAVMIHLEDIHKLDERIVGIDMVRVLVNAKKTELSSVACEKELSHLVSLGYTVALNIAYADTLTDDEIDIVLGLFVHGIQYIYIADTFGSMTNRRLKYLVRYIKKRVDVNIGFHGHNNTGGAINNSIDAITNGVSIVDVTIGGKGRGGGNTATEMFIQHANKKFRTEYNIMPILEHLSSLSYRDKLAILHTCTGLYRMHPNVATDILKNEESLSVAYRHIMDRCVRT